MAWLAHFNPYHDENGRFTSSNESVFISGSSKTQDPGSGYYRKELPPLVRDRIDRYMKRGDKIIVGDAPGIDRQVQDYLHKNKYKNVEIYGPGKQLRYVSDSKWKQHPIDNPDAEPGSKEWLAKKDVAMTDASTRGLAVILDQGSSATRNNVKRLVNQMKPVEVIQLSGENPETDKFIDDYRSIIVE